ncbi:MAG: GntR family transcriptional regulator [Paraglaciecola sp.]|jgi:DNA-binding GntR family transcriptional regulator|uniref:GntR family transcriptional regulator n=1 Tax=Paraglaciecola sp. TaxID=1920173 RepID=UPI00273E2C6A|nr:GntR family transcriptional regulator [Paraglaciecola sp.]MDP5031267.1 GntR family transcriptional regulator [Paraglaciecola sp.]MDP5133125.1 GntR family transcriptional regulator [Paraglaciecola sp.]
MNTVNFEVKSIDRIIASGIKKEGSLVDQIYLVLRENIINLSLPPEMALVEKEIAAIFEISKTPVREALIRLANDRLVTIVPKSGSYVTAISLERYLEACFIRVSLESGCVKRLADKGISLSEQVKLKGIITEQQQAINNKTSNKNALGNPASFEIDALFHRTLFEYAGILGAWLLLDSSKAEMDRVRHLQAKMGIARSSTVVDEYSKIVEAIIGRDTIAAEKAMVYHIGDVDDEMDIISNNPKFIKSMEEFNSLINEQRKRRNASRFNGSLFVGKRVVF